MRMRFRSIGSSAVLIACAALSLASAGCRDHQYARVIQPGQKEMVGSHQAGQETFRPMIDEAVAKLMARHSEHAVSVRPVGAGAEPLPPPKASLFFVGVENCTAEEIGDFKAQIYELIDGKIAECGVFTPLNRRYVDSGLRELRLRPDDLFQPQRLETFTDLMQRQGHPFQYLLYARLTSGTTRENKDYQRDYLLTLELVDVRTGEQDKQTATISKGYHHSWTSRARANLFPW